MSSQSVKKKSVNLILILFIIFLLIALVFIGIKFLNTDDSEETENETNITNVSMTVNVSTENSISNTLTNSVNNLDDFESIENTNTLSNNILNSTNNTISNNTTNQNSTTPTQSQNQENTVTLSNHTYSLPNTLNFSKKTNGAIGDYLLLKYPNYEFEIEYMTYNSNFNTLKTSSSLKKFLEDTFKVSITSDLKSGNLKNLDLIACSISDNSKPAYLIITPLNDTEIICTKIYNTNDSTKLISDLSDPLERISEMKSYLKN